MDIFIKIRLTDSVSSVNEINNAIWNVPKEGTAHEWVTPLHNIVTESSTGTREVDQNVLTVNTKQKDKINEIIL